MIKALKRYGQKKVVIKSLKKFRPKSAWEVVIKSARAVVINQNLSSGTIGRGTAAEAGFSRP